MALGDASVEANISENVADIYQDLKDFILSYRIGTVEVMRAALWECRNNSNNVGAKTGERIACGSCWCMGILT